MCVFLGLQGLFGCDKLHKHVWVRVSEELSVRATTVHNLLCCVEKGGVLLKKILQFSCLSSLFLVCVLDDFMAVLLFGVLLFLFVVSVQLVSLLFDSLPASFEWGSEAALFLSVLNGALLLHCEDQALLRLCTATYINSARKFVNLFPLHG